MQSLPARFTIAVDDTEPSSASITVPGGWHAGGPVTITVGAQATDAGSGIASQQLQRDEAPRPVGGTCADAAWPGTFATTIGPAAVTLPPTIADPGVVSGSCYRYRVAAIDHVSNVATSAVTAAVAVDRIMPTATIAATPSSPFRATAAVSGTADDGIVGPNSGIAAVTLRWESLDDATTGTIGSVAAPAGAWSLAWDTVAGSRPDGAYRIHLDVVDVAGNVVPNASTRDVVIDNSPPVVALAGFDAGAPAACQHWAGLPSTTFYFSTLGAGCGAGDFTIRVTASDAPGGLDRVAFPGAAIASLDVVADLDPADDPAAPWSMHYAYGAAAGSPGDRIVTAWGASGASTELPVRIVRDDDGPAGGSLVAPGDDTAPGWWSRRPSEDVAFTVGADADAGLQSHRIERRDATGPSCGGWSAWTVLPGSTGAASPFVDATTTDGSCHQYRLVATDNVGNETVVDAPASRQVRVDRTPPNGSIDLLPPAVRGTVTVTGAAGDTGSGIAQVIVRVEDAAATTTTPCTLASPGGSWSCSWDTTGAATGTATVRATIVDLAGNGHDVDATTFVDNAIPTGTVALVEGGGAAYQHVVAGPQPLLWFNPTRTGDVAVAVAASDAGTGVEHVAFPTLGSGWTRTPASGVVSAPGPYAATHAWGSGAVAPGPTSVQLVDDAGNLGSAAWEVRADGDAPTGGSIDYPGGPASSPAITLTPSVDALSGVGTWQLQRSDTTVTGPGTCDGAGWGAFADIGTPSPASPWTDGSVTVGSCYRYRLVTVDNVGNERVVVDAEGDVVTVEPAGIVVLESGSTEVAEGGATDGYTIRLRTRPAADVTVTLGPDAQVGVDGPTRTFTTSNWNVPRPIVVNAVDDPDDEGTGTHPGRITHVAASADPAYDGLVGADVVAAVTDDDEAGFVVSADVSSIAVGEAGATTDTYSIRLTSRPIADVVITVATPDGQVASAPAGITFTPADWSADRSVTVTAVDDDWDEDATHPGVVTHAVTSTDPNYAGRTIPDAVATVADDDTARVLVTPTTGLAVAEAGTTTATYAVRLGSRPRADVLVGVTGDADASVAPSSLLFTDGDWDTDRIVTMTAVDDAVAEGAHPATAAHLATSTDPRYDGIPVEPVTATVTDDDAVGFEVVPTTGLAAAEGGVGSSYQLRLTSEPVAPVTVTPSPDAQLQGMGALTFDAGTWNAFQTVTVAAVDDDVDEPDEPHVGTITHSIASSDPAYASSTIPAGQVAITDDDTAALLVDELGGVAVAESAVATTDTFTVRLATRPTGPVTVTPSSDAQVGVTGGPLTFTTTDWNTPRTLTVAAVDDPVDEAATHPGAVTLAVASGDPRHAALTPVQLSVAVTDDDAAGVVVSAGALALAEAGATTGTYTVVLGSRPASAVTVSLGPDAQVTTHAPSIVFTPADWSSPKVVTVRAVDDPVVEQSTHPGLVAHVVTSADPAYAGIAVADVTATVTDDDVAGVAVDTLDGVAVTEGGGSDVYRVRLTGRPQADVTVTVTADAQVTASPTVLTFSPAGWNTIQEVRVDAVDDPDVEPPHAGQLTHVVSSTDPLWAGITTATAVSASITDDDVAGVHISDAGPHLVAEATPGTTASYSVRLDSRPTADVTVTLAAPADLDVNPTTLLFPRAAWDIPQVVTIGAVDDLVAEAPVHARIVTHGVASLDPDYQGVAVEDVTASVTDDDIAGVLISTSAIAATEGGATGGFAVSLRTQPVADVLVTLDGGAQVTTDVTTLLFTPSTWSTPQPVVATAVDDDVDEHPDTHPGAVALSVASADPGYHGWTLADVAVAITDDDVAGISVLPGATPIAVSEAGGVGATYSLRLTSRPTANVVVTLGTADGQVTTDAPSVTFTPAGWNTAHDVTVTAVDDPVDETDVHPALVTHAAASVDPHYAGIGVDPQPVEVADDDSAAVVVSPASGLSVAEAATGTTASFTVRLATRPLGPVTVALATPDGQTTVAPASLTFDPASWSGARVVVVTAVDDHDDEAASHPARVETSVASASDPGYAAIDPDDVDVMVDDDDTARVIVTESGGSTDVSEAGATDTWELVLASRPSADVTVQVAGGAQADASPSSIAFTPGDWDVPRTVTATATPDPTIEGPHVQRFTHDVTSADGAYDGLAVPDVDASVADDDAAGITVSPGSLAVVEGGAAATYEIELTARPAADVTVQMTPDPQLDAGATTLVFGPADWDVAQAVTVTAVDDDVAEGSPHPGTIAHVLSSTDPDFDGAAASDVTASITDDDVAGVVVDPVTATVSEAGATATYDVRLSSRPLHDVDVTFDTGSQLQPIATRTFSPSTWNVPQPVNIVAVDDLVAEGLHPATVSHAAASTDPAYGAGTLAIDPVAVSILDDDTAGVLASTTTGLTATEGGAPAVWSVSLTSQPAADVTLTLVSSVHGIVSPSTITFTPLDWATPRPVSVTAVDDQVARGAHVVTVASTVSSSDAFYDGLAVPDQSIDAVDDDVAAIILSPAAPGPLAITEGGAPGTYTIVLATEPIADVQVDTAALGIQAVAAPGSITFTPGSWNVPQEVEVAAVDDDVSETSPHADAITNTANSVDPAYANLVIADMDVAVTDDDVPGVRILATLPDTRVAENGPADTVRVVLTSRPAAGVDVLLTGTGVTLDPPNFTVTPDAWNTPRDVAVTAIDDEVFQGSRSGAIEALGGSSDPLYAGVVAPSHPVTVDDDDVAQLVVDELDGVAVAEAGTTSDTFTVRLGAKPSDDVEVTFTADAQLAGMAGAGITFTPTSWKVPQVVTVSAAQDLATETSPHVGRVTFTSSSDDADFDALATADLDVDVADDDVPELVVRDTAATPLDEADGAGTERLVGVRLGTQPSGTVQVMAISDGQVMLMLTNVLTFTPADWSTEQFLRVQAVDDPVAEPASHRGAVSFTFVAASDPGYASLAAPALEVDIIDDDIAAAAVRCDPGPGWDDGGDGRLDVAEDPADPAHVVTCALQLGTAAAADVTIDVTTGPTGQLAVDRPSVTIPAGEQGATVLTFTATDDAIDEQSPHPASIFFAVSSSDAIYGALTMPSVDVDVADDDTAGVVVTPSGPIAITEGGAPATVQVALSARPSAPVVVTLDGGPQAQASPAMLTFLPDAWNTPQAVQLSATNDPHDEADVHDGEVVLALASSDPVHAAAPTTPLRLAITDDDTPGVVVAATGDGTTVTEGGAGDEVSVRLATRPSGPVTVTLAADGQVTAASGVLTFTPDGWNAPQQVALGAVQDDVLEGAHAGNVAVTLASSDATYAAGSAATPAGIAVNVADDDQAGITIVEAGGTAVAEGGATDTYTIALAAKPTTDVLIRVAGGTQLTASPAELTFSPSTWNAPQTVTVAAVQDGIDEPEPHPGELLHTAVAAGWAEARLTAVAAKVGDDDVASIVVAQSDDSTHVTEGTTKSDTVSFRLASEPAGDVSIQATGDSQLELPTGPLVIRPSAWRDPVQLEVRARDDKEVEGDHQGSVTLQVTGVDATYAKLRLDPINVRISDDDIDTSEEPAPEAPPEPQTRTPQAIPPATRQPATPTPAPDGSRRTDDGATRTREGSSSRPGAGLGTIGSGIQEQAVTEDEEAAAKRLEDLGETVDASSKEKSGPKGPSIVTEAVRWIKDHWKVAVPLLAMSLVGMGGLSFMLRRDPIKLAQRGARAARMAADIANGEAPRIRNPRPRRRRRGDDDDEDDEPTSDLRDRR